LRCFGSHRKHGLHAANMRNSDQSRPRWNHPLHSQLTSANGRYC
jgi:hypothetical protein